MSRSAAFGLVFTVLAATAAGAQVDNCADCHLSRPDAPRPEHVSDWQRSEHSRADVGCHDCHGGNPDTFEVFNAHEGLAPSTDSASPVHRANLVTTCGRCHSGQLVEFRKSRHFELLQDGDGPTCSSCHGSVGSHLFSPRGLERRCSRCHGAEKVGEHPEFPGQARAIHERVIAIRELLRPSRKMIRRIDDDARRADLQSRLEQAEVPLLEAVHEGHSFTFDGVRERLEVALTRAEALAEDLANPTHDSSRQERNR